VDSASLLSRLRSRTWRGTPPRLVWDDAAGEFRERSVTVPPDWLRYVPVVADLHEHRAIFGSQALTVAVFRRPGRSLRGERTAELWAVMAVGDRKRPTWVEAYVGTEGEEACVSK
jgi:hypothetical protein